MSKIYYDIAAEELTHATDSLFEDDGVRTETDRSPSPPKKHNRNASNGDRFRGFSKTWLQDSHPGIDFRAF